MSLIKIIAYLIGAAAILFVAVSPNKPPNANPAETAPRNNVPPLAATSSESAENETANGSEKAMAKTDLPEQIAVPEPKLKTFVPLPVIPIPYSPPQTSRLPAEDEKLTTDSVPLSSTTNALPVTAQKETVPAQATAPSFEEINKQTRAALVNIICTTIRSGSFEPLTGSGILVDPRGVILTNAHIAEYFLLKDYLVPNFINCTIRAGEPARNRYKAALLYLSPLWIEANYRKIRLADPTGTGEYDFAFLLITESVNPETLPLPKEFPALAMDFTDETLRKLQPDGLAIVGKNQVLAAGYPAGFLSGINIQKDLYPSSSIVTVGDVYTFRENTPDVFSVGGSVLAQKGASGGAVVSVTGKLIGLIVTASEAATTGERNLNAITPSHIARSFKEHTGDELEVLFASDLAASAESFNQNVAPALTKLLEDEINRRSE